MVIDLQADGRVRGVIDEPGCKLSGLHTQHVAPYMAAIDVTLTANAAARETKLQLNAFASNAFAVKVTLASIDAVLKR